MFNIAIVEDELAAADVLCDYIKRYGEEHEELFRTVCYHSALDLLTNYSSAYDIIFMDIELPHIDGMEGARRVRQMDKSVTIIFVTNMAQFAVKGYEVDAFDFIVKPVSYYGFALKIQKALDRIKLRDDKAIIISNQEGYRKLLLSEIKYIEIEKHRIISHTISGIYESYGTLKSIEEKLPKERFVRCNSCFLVNLKYVDGIDGFVVQVGKDRLQISRSRRKELIRALNDYIIKEL